MCRAVTCSTCGKTTWAGCGRHVEQVMAKVPERERCPGHPRQERSPAGGRIGRLLGRSRRPVAESSPLAWHLGAPGDRI